MRLKPSQQALAFVSLRACESSMGVVVRKRKGIARVRLNDGDIVLAELHWYEATGIGKREFKIKRLL
jgi:hypothetical protein